MIHAIDKVFPDNVQAFYSDRCDGESLPPFGKFNLAQHVGDEPSVVARNREKLPHAEHWHWLNQVHSSKAVQLPSIAGQPLSVDASYTNSIKQGCIIMTADCLPILVSAADGSEVAAIHAGWRGLSGGIIERTIKQLNSSPKDLIFWFGPAISRRHFEVGDDVKQQFPSELSRYFEVTPAHNKFMFDLRNTAISIAKTLGVTQIVDHDDCTFALKGRYFSYRRDGQTGRQVSGILKLA